jgi:hypothetical protein
MPHDSGIDGMDRPYIVVGADDATELQEEVNAAIARGYWPLGAPAVVVEKVDPLLPPIVGYYQAMTKERSG